MMEGTWNTKATCGTDVKSVVLGLGIGLDGDWSGIGIGPVEKGLEVEVTGIAEELGRDVLDEMEWFRGWCEGIKEAGIELSNTRSG